jgi:hypothetical protein
MYVGMYVCRFRRVRNYELYVLVKVVLSSKILLSYNIWKNS